jgi:hypothetical protein
MRAQRRSTKGLANRQAFVFHRRRPENVLRVEIGQSGVVVHSSEGNFLPRHKEMFVRYLVDEGFISEQYRYFSWERSETWAGLRWVVDGRTVRFARGGAVWRAKTFIRRLSASRFVSWAVQLGALVLLIRR